MIVASLRHCFHAERHVPGLYRELDVSQQPACRCLPVHVQLRDCKEWLDTVCIDMPVAKNIEE